MIRDQIKHLSTRAKDLPVKITLTTQGEDIGSIIDEVKYRIASNSHFGCKDSEIQILILSVLNNKYELRVTYQGSYLGAFK